MRVLMVAYYFPPVGGGGVNRTLKVVRGVAAAGWDPVVLTVDAAAWVQDRELLAQVPRRAKVLRLPNPDWGRVARWMERGSARSRGSAEAAPSAGPPAAVRRRSTPGRLRRWLVPDLHVGWSALTVPVASAMAATGAVDLVYTTCPPYSANAAGLAARALGLPWVADFRDAWLECPTRADLSPRRRRLERRLEERVLRRADRVLFASAGARACALRRVPDLDDRSETVLTGFDLRDFAPTPGIAPAAGRLELVHAGSLLLNQMGENLDCLLRALGIWSRRDPSVSRTVRLGLVGAEPEVERRVARAGLGDWVRVEPGVPRSGLARRLRRAHAALVLTAAAPFGGDPIPGKVFDAVGAGRPLLALAPPGALAELVRERALGEVVEPESSEEIIAALSRLRERALAGVAMAGPPRESREALSNGRAVERILAAMESARSQRAEDGGTCPYPSAW